MTIRMRAGAAIVVSVLLAGLSMAGAQEQLPPNPTLSTPLTAAVPVDPRITVGQLPNGLR
jgi:hypothetical protein